MTGDAPQPGETSHHDGDPWTFADPDASWWRGETDPGSDDAGPARHRREPATSTSPPEGGTGVLLPPGFDRDDPTHAAFRRPPQQEQGADLSRPPRNEQAADLSHPAQADQTTDEAVTQARRAADQDVAAALRPAIKPDLAAAPLPTLDPSLMTVLRPAIESAAIPAPMQPPTSGSGQVPPLSNNQNRPTVALDWSTVPGQAPRPHPSEAVQHRKTEPLPRPIGTPATDARLEKLENSPFWLDEHERAATQPAAEPTRVAKMRHRAPRRTGWSLLSLVALALVSTFFAWVSAEPFWIAVGHDDHGYATTAHCVGSGLTQRCTGTFAAADGDYSTQHVALLGVAAEQRTNGAVTPARMVSADSGHAYLSDTGLLMQLRWIVGVLVLLICGYAIASCTGARELETARARRSAVLISLAGPLVLLAGFLAATY